MGTKTKLVNGFSPRLSVCGAGNDTGIEKPKYISEFYKMLNNTLESEWLWAERTSWLVIDYVAELKLLELIT